jgi:hypothetical protein
MMNNFSPDSHSHNAPVNDPAANPAAEDGAVLVSRPISVPHFMDSLLSLGEEMVMQVGPAKDWHTEDLKAKVDLALPGTNNKNIDGKRDSLALKEKFDKIFYTGRKFASYWQLYQAVNYLASHWSFITSNTGGAIKCYFAKYHTGQLEWKKSKVLAHKKQDVPTPLKEVIDCPFQICYGVSRLRLEENKHHALRTVHIQKKTYCLHTCDLTHANQIISLGTSSKLQPDLGGCKALFDAIYWHPPHPSRS